MFSRSMFPVDVRFLAEDGRHSVRMNPHECFEVLYTCAGPANYRIQDRLLGEAKLRTRMGLCFQPL